MFSWLCLELSDNNGSFQDISTGLPFSNFVLWKNKLW